ncbi:DUF2666 family protein [Thermococcus peptonophilus]|uniref:DUF2666 family protein n=1 Tax=Thermococcus peptonophilus TaxID=53952 RepID=UPI000ADE3916
MRIEEHVAFTAKHNDWQVAKKLTELEDEAVAHFLAGIANSVNTRIPHYMSENIDLEGIRRLAEEVRKDTLSDTIVALKSPGTSRKLGALVKEGDKKLKKLLVDAAKAVLVRITLEEIVPPVNYPPEGELTGGVDVEFPYEEDHVNFTAKHGKWIVVKRLIIDEKTPPT